MKWNGKHLQSPPEGSIFLAEAAERYRYKERSISALKARGKLEGTRGYVTLASLERYTRGRFK